MITIWTQTSYSIGNLSEITWRLVFSREAERPLLSREQREAWSKPYEENDLVKTAKDFHESVTDPKLKNSQVDITSHSTVILKRVSTQALGHSI